MTTRDTKHLSIAAAPVHYLTRIGLWGDSRGLVRRFAPPFLIGQSLYGFVTQVINLYQTRKEFAVASEYFTALLTSLMVGVKTVCLVANAGKIQEILTAIAELRKTHLHDDEGSRLLESSRRTADKFLRPGIIILLVILATDSYLIAIFCLYKRRIILRRWFPIDISPSPLFEIVLFSVITLIILDIYLVLLFDTLTYVIIYELIWDFKLLQRRITFIDRADNADNADKAVTTPPVNSTYNRRDNVGNLHFISVAPFSNNRSGANQSCSSTWPAQRMHDSSAHDEAFCKQRVASCVVHHRALIRLVSMLETALQPALVCHLVNNFCIGATITLVSLKGSEMDLYLSWGISCLGLATVIEFSLYCYCFTKLTTESSLVGEALYGCSWWEASVPFKRSMNIMQLRLNQPLVVYAAGLYPMSMQTFTAVMDTAYSMYNMMLSTS